MFRDWVRYIVAGKLREAKCIYVGLSALPALEVSVVCGVVWVKLGECGEKADSVAG